jgi:hypothetical protein
VWARGGVKEVAVAVAVAMVVVVAAMEAVMEDKSPC